MATGPFHYTEAERLLGEAHDQPEGSEMERYLLAAAQVHQGLALTIATALKGTDDNAWIKVAGEQPLKREDGGS